MRRVIVAALLALSASQMSGQRLEIRDVFKQMPDSDANMKAEVKNRLGGTSEMLGLSSDSLSIRMSSSLRADLFLLPLSTPVDSVSDVVVMVETFLADSIHGQSHVSYFTTDWKKLSTAPPLSDIQQKRIQACVLQTILKKDDEIVNKY